MSELIGKITEVRSTKQGYSITKEDDFSLYIDKKHGIVPKVGDTITTYHMKGIYSRIRGIKINDKILFMKTIQQMEEEYKKWIEDTKKKYAKEYKELIEKIKDEEPFETINISGFGGGYERGCQLMLRSGLTFIKKHPNYDWNELTYGQSLNIVGIATPENKISKELDKVLSKACPDATGAMHQAVVNHIMYIVKYGYDSWLKKYKDRKYKYPSELPEPSFGKRR